MSGSPGRGRDDRKLERDSGLESHRQARNWPRGVGDTSPEPAIETASRSLQMMATPRCRGSCRAPGAVKHPLWGAGVRDVGFNHAVQLDRSIVEECVCR